MTLKITVLLVVFLLSPLSVFGYEINNIFITSSSSESSYWVNQERDEADDSLLITSLESILDSYKNNSLSAYTKYIINPDDLIGLDIDKTIIPKLLKKKKRNIKSFSLTADALHRSQIEMANAVFTGIKRENIDKKGNLSIIRKVYLAFEVDGKEHLIYLRTLVKSKDNIWKMTKESSLVKETKLNSNKLMMCSQEAKQCADGSFVSRNSKNSCKFNPCL